MKEEVMYQGENIKERGKIFIKLLLPVLILSGNILFIRNDRNIYGWAL